MNPVHYKKISFLALIIITSLFACVDDDYFGTSDLNEIIEFSVPGQSGSTAINSEAAAVSLSVGNGIDRSALAPNIFITSNFASVMPDKYGIQDFTDPVEYIVRSESGIEKRWTITVSEQGADPQLQNSDFNLWYETSAGLINPILYDEPGENENSTIWATANYGLTNYGDEPNTTPVDLGEDDFAARLITVKAPAVVPLAAATLFTGEFDLNIINPPKSAIFGIPFAGRPSGFRLNYAYVPGDENIGVTADECDIYVLLEKREDDSVSRIATGWFRDGTDTGTSEWTVLEVDLKYGPLTAADPEFAYANIPSDQTWADPDETPTHISVVFSSSALGDSYEGAIGSILVVDDFELIYN